MSSEKSPQLYARSGDTTHKDDPYLNNAHDSQHIEHETGTRDTERVVAGLAPSEAENAVGEMDVAQPTRRSSRTRKPTSDVVSPFDEPKPKRPKMSPACSSCRQAKIRCQHRSVLFESGTEDQVPLTKRKKGFDNRDTKEKVGADSKDDENEPSSEPEMDELSSPLAKKALRDQRKQEQAEEEKDESYSSSLLDLGGLTQMDWDARDKRRGTQSKDDARTDPPESTGESGSGVQTSSMATLDTSRPLQGPSEVGTKLETGSIGKDVDQADSDTEQVPTGLVKQGFPSFPADNLEAAGQLSVHSVFSQDLQRKLDDCETRWLAAIDSLRSAKQTLDSWVGIWQKGL